MILTAYINDKTYELDVPEAMHGKEGEEFFAKMDADMDKGWQMSRDFVDNPDRVQRCQIAADHILTAISNGNSTLALLMSAYIFDRLPGVTAINIDVDGEMMNTSFYDEVSNPNPAPISPEQARTRAEQDVSNVYKVGKVWKFSRRNEMTGAWEESPTVKTEEEANAMRDSAIQKRCAELTGIRISFGS